MSILAFVSSCQWLSLPELSSVFVAETDQGNKDHSAVPTWCILFTQHRAILRVELPDGTIAAAEPGPGDN